MRLRSGGSIESDVVMVLSSDNSVAASVENARTLILECPICRSDAAETLGIVGSIDGQHDETVILQCQECLTVYFSPRPGIAAADSVRLPVSFFSGSKVSAWVSGLQANSRVLLVDSNLGADSSSLTAVAPKSWSVERIGVAEITNYVKASAKKHDLILLPLTLETVVDPYADMNALSALLSDVGRIVVVTYNAGSSCFCLFGGRHWAGYRYPQSRQHFTKEALTVLARDSGLTIRELRTSTASSIWLDSTRRWLQDWGSGPATTALLTGPWLMPQVISHVLEFTANVRGRGSILTALMDKRGAHIDG